MVNPPIIPALSAFSRRNVPTQFMPPLSVTVAPPLKMHKHTIKKPWSHDSEPPTSEGQYARTDENVRIQHPSVEHLPHTPVFPSHGGRYLPRDLANGSLENKVSVVTGGARGIGLAMCQALIASGCNLAIVDLSGEAAQEQAINLTEQFKKESPRRETNRIPKITAHQADVASPTSVTKTLAVIISQHGQIDHLVTSAGFTENFDAISYPHDRMQRLWGVVVDGTYLFAAGVARHLMQRKAPGTMVFVGSMSGSIVNVPQPQAPYNAAKAAVAHLAKSLAVEWAGDRIRVNCVSPGYILTPLTRKILDENPALRERWTSLIPVGEMGRPEDLMGPVMFLLSDAARYVTGTNLCVDGGYTLT